MTRELFQEDAYLRECEATVEFVETEQKCFSTQQTVFYPTGGGQPGDRGMAISLHDDGVPPIEITNTQRDRVSGRIRHYVKNQDHLPGVGDRLLLKIDWHRRSQLMRVHSCLHLLCAVIPSRVTGCQVHEGRGRLDFDLSEPLDKDQVAFRLNLLIQQGAKRKNLQMSSAEIEAGSDFSQSFSVPAPKNLDAVHIVVFEGIDIQPCGGTHVKNSSEIGYARIESIKNKGKYNRRVTVVLDE